MAWVKRGGGTGTGPYGRQALPTTGAPTPRRPAPPVPGPADSPEPSPAAPGVAPAYRVSQYSEVRNHKILLDLLAQGVRAGREPVLSMYYQDALATFGADSVHFTAACQGQAGAGTHYQHTVAGGRFRTPD
ncbi:hypothetical protein E7744_15325 (plasmid) [Citricoccus sp. SGAir0253]|uniref:hypothetical protein n=1 Tax=Citricoccus sp. SGAir0253 TaxID=2567881 RepID=UPI0010CD2D17|nr:hypothetical protein [Citricoccus sp. SGAir0253]QCU79686.1 hypothetical protein E7744_15325 [Citricoccus sp. SGAir0253]